MSPAIAVSENGKAVAAWREVQSAWNVGDDFTTVKLTQNRILFKVYDGSSWSDETYILYNGSAGDVTGISIEMIGDIAAVAFALNDGSSTETYAESGEIYYSIVTKRLLPLSATLSSRKAPPSMQAGTRTARPSSM